MTMEFRYCYRTSSIYFMYCTNDNIDLNIRICSKVTRFSLLVWIHQLQSSNPVSTEKDKQLLVLLCGDWIRALELVNPDQKARIEILGDERVK